MYDYHSISLSSFEMLALNVLVLSLIMLALYKGESRLDSDSPWAMLSLLAVFGISGRILLDPLPNIQPVTMLVLVVGIYFGGWRAIALAGVIAWTSNAIALGHGPWTLFQALGWGAVGLLGASLSGFLREGDRLMVGRLAFVSAASAFLFDWTVSLSILLDASTSMIIPYLINGLAFDLYHAAGNVAFVAWMAAPLGDMILRHSEIPASEAVSEVAPN